MIDTRELVDPQLLPFLDALPGGAVNRHTLPARRERSDALILAQLPDDLPVLVEEQYLSGPTGPASLRILKIQRHDLADKAPALLHCHGGGLVMGKPESSLPTLRHMAMTLGVVIVSVDYRLAPEAPYPAAIDDCYAALEWMHDNAKALRIDSQCIGVTGESAGGNLAAALCLMARDRAGPPIAYQNLVYPMLDDRADATDNPVVGQFCWTRESNRFAWNAYLGATAHDAVSPYAAPARESDYERLPPLYLSTGALDLFLDENIRFVQALAAAGVAVEVDIYPGAFHAFDVAPDADVSIRARARRLDAMRRAIDGVGD
ncbi:arylesterase [Neoasaia chiangmaiensis NBRC 101099]|uniref:Uncharacterized protein n=1 Tax=Neoasaia chiangmaiensis TaxID=320497 RepID=A0A1U9KSV7_9PROT|nr:alpha/beta hydrolase [Neoasaia chiangmaiensis]AQS88913.1 hypothetical protein A0U93_14410 [Neoasaia chiangmaiensis]GBR40418.1 arylesterase [Neoasaia chiangmaiensis NBRC 101099]GEN13909.1 esterase [Neoasaia chiangmaiensis]